MTSYVSTDTSNSGIESSFEADLEISIHRFGFQEDELTQEGTNNNRQIFVIEFTDSDYDTDSVLDDTIDDDIKAFLTKSTLETKFEENNPSIELLDNFNYIFHGKYEGMIKHGKGCKFFIKCLPQLSSEIISLIFVEIEKNIPDLINDEKGIIFCQEFNKFLNLFQKINFQRKL